MAPRKRKTVRSESEESSARSESDPPKPPSPPLTRNRAKSQKIVVKDLKDIEEGTKRKVRKPKKLKRGEQIDTEKADEDMNGDETDCDNMSRAAELSQTRVRLQAKAVQMKEKGKLLLEKAAKLRLDVKESSSDAIEGIINDSDVLETVAHEDEVLFPNVQETIKINSRTTRVTIAQEADSSNSDSNKSPHIRTASDSGPPPSRSGTLQMRDEIDSNEHDKQNHQDARSIDTSMDVAMSHIVDIVPGDRGHVPNSSTIPNTDEKTVHKTADTSSNHSGSRSSSPSSGHEMVRFCDGNRDLHDNLVKLGKFVDFVSESKTTVANKSNGEGQKLLLDLTDCDLVPSSNSSSMCKRTTCPSINSEMGEFEDEEAESTGESVSGTNMNRHQDSVDMFVSDSSTPPKHTIRPFVNGTNKATPTPSDPAASAPSSGESVSKKNRIDNEDSYGMSEDLSTPSELLVCSSANASNKAAPSDHDDSATSAVVIRKVSGNMSTDSSIFDEDSTVENGNAPSEINVKSMEFVDDEEIDFFEKDCSISPKRMVQLKNEKALQANNGSVNHTSAPSSISVPPVTQPCRYQLLKRTKFLRLNGENDSSKQRSSPPANTDSALQTELDYRPNESIRVDTSTVVSESGAKTRPTASPKEIVNRDQETNDERLLNTTAELAKYAREMLELSSEPSAIADGYAEARRSLCAIAYGIPEDSVMINVPNHTQLRHFFPPLYNKSDGSIDIFALIPISVEMKALRHNVGYEDWVVSYIRAARGEDCAKELKVLEELSLKYLAEIDKNKKPMNRGS